MIAYLTGVIAEKLEQGCLLLTDSGVGYEVHLPGHTLAGLPARGERIELFVCTVVREDAIELFGFSSWDERQTFITLTSISKVGAKTGNAVLSLFRPDDLRRMVAEDDWIMLTRVSGIGKKTAQHIFLELKYKLASGTDMAVVSGQSQNLLFKDALTGLTNLGYDEHEAGSALQEALSAEPDLDVGEALRTALKILARRKSG